MVLALKSRLVALGAALLGALAFLVRMQFLKNKNERLQREADTLRARAIQEKVLKEKEKETKKEFRSRETDLLRSLEEKREDEESFKGLDNLNRPNDW